jgi:hypothetical protein
LPEPYESLSSRRPPPNELVFLSSSRRLNDDVLSSRRPEPYESEVVEPKPEEVWRSLSRSPPKPDWPRLLSEPYELSSLRLVLLLLLLPSLSAKPWAWFLIYRWWSVTVHVEWL